MSSDTSSGFEFNVHWLPGMGADRRLFSKIKVERVVHHYHEWRHLPGAKTLSDYASWLAENIDTERNIYIGSSMGGMMATELMRVKPADHLILLSAPSGRHEFPALLKNLSAIRIGRWFSPRQMHALNRMANTFMGFKNAEDQALFFEMLEGYGPEFLHFAVNAILEWKPSEFNYPYVQIVGGDDRLFKSDRMRSPIVLPGAGHFMTWEKPEDLSALIQREIDHLIETKRSFVR
ncbi:MAG: alpha/beta hydrolase [Flavobacteriales bacterium]|nr:alpha/beta hydrolase [Flavobacteriales bacterium]